MTQRQQKQHVEAMLVNLVLFIEQGKWSDMERTQLQGAAISMQLYLCLIEEPPDES